MTKRNEAHYEKVKTELMEKSFECFAEYGLGSVGIRGLGQYCGVSSALLYVYFDDLDDLIVKATAHCMSKVEEDFMARAPRSLEELDTFIRETPKWTAEQHGKKYRLMYQVYTHPKYREEGKKFFAGVDSRYTEYAKSLEPRLGIPYQKLTPLIFILVRACVHYALFEDEYYLKSQIDILRETIGMFLLKYNRSIRAGEQARQAKLARKQQFDSGR